MTLVNASTSYSLTFFFLYLLFAMRVYLYAPVRHGSGSQPSLPPAVVNSRSLCYLHRCPVHVNFWVIPVPPTLISLLEQWCSQHKLLRLDSILSVLDGK